jgi:hypothetical protein
MRKLIHSQESVRWNRRRDEVEIYALKTPRSNGLRHNLAKMGLVARFEPGGGVHSPTVISRRWSIDL